MISIKQGNKRLLALADILAKVPRKRRLKNGQKRGYDQSAIIHECGSPACAWGWWAHSNPTRARRIRKEAAARGGYYSPGTSEYGFGVVRWTPYTNADCEFHLSSQEREELFAASGCARAKNGKQAATYIRKFVAVRGGV